MKIDTNLRVAIRSAVKVHNETVCSYDHAIQQQEQEVKRVASMPRHKDKVNKALSARSVAIKELDKANKVLDSIGVDSRLRSVCDREKFEKAGGKIIVRPKPLNADVILNSIAMADAKEAATIIKQLGLKWE